MEILFCHTPLIIKGEKEPFATAGKAYEVIERVSNGSYVITGDSGFKLRLATDVVHHWFNVVTEPNYDRLKSLLGWLYESMCQGARLEPQIEKEIRYVLGYYPQGDPFKQ